MNPLLLDLVNSKGSPFHKEYDRNEVKAYIVCWLVLCLSHPCSYCGCPEFMDSLVYGSQRWNSLVGEAPAVGVATCFMAFIGAADPESP